jgi:hypothetical protein
MELMLSIIESDLREHPSLFVLLVIKALNKNELATSNRWENPAKKELPEGSVVCILGRGKVSVF